MNDWQTWVAGAIVLITLGLFIRSFTRKTKNKKNCGSNCGCDMK